MSDGERLQPLQPVGECGQEPAEAAQDVWLLRGRRQSRRARALRGVCLRLAQGDLPDGRPGSQPGACRTLQSVGFGHHPSAIRRRRKRRWHQRQRTDRRSDHQRDHSRHQVHQEDHLLPRWPWRRRSRRCEGQNGYGTLKTALEGEGFEIKKLLLAHQASVPDDCTTWRSPARSSRSTRTSSTPSATTSKAAGA